MNDVQPDPNAKWGDNGFVTHCQVCGMLVFYQHYQINDQSLNPPRPHKGAAIAYDPFNMQMGEHRNKHTCRKCKAGCLTTVVWRGWMDENRHQGYYTNADGPAYLLQHRCHKWIEQNKPEVEEYNLEYTVVPTKLEQERKDELADIERRIEALRKRKSELEGNG